MAKTEIYKFDLRYAILKPIIHCIFTSAYRKVEFTGLENIPKDAPVIFSPNHTNALMDALAVLSINSMPKVFVARMDLFNKPLIAKILTFFKIMPIVRIRDGYQNLKKNNQTIDNAVEVLCHNTPFCIFPEAAHNTQRTLLPLTKGIFRIALQAQAQIDRPLYIVPLGVDYGNYYRYRTTLLVNIGQPINVMEYAKRVETEGEPIIMGEMKRLCAERMSELILSIPRDENCDVKSDICAIKAGCAETKITTLKDRLDVNQKIAKSIENYIESDPKQGAELLSLGQEFRAKRIEMGVSLNSVVRKISWVKVLLNLIVLLLLLPFALVGAVLFGWYEYFVQKIVSLIKDPVFSNTIRFGFNLLLNPILTIVYTVIIWALTSWEWALVGFVLFIPAPYLILDYSRKARILLSDVKVLRCSELKTLIDKIRNINLFSNVSS